MEISPESDSKISSLRESSLKPRSIKVLYALGVVYEMMHDYEKAKEVIEPLGLLKEDTQTLKKFLDFSQITANKQTST